ncbi:hypothetical protein D3C87_919470 [compost metagenome]
MRQLAGRQAHLAIGGDIEFHAQCRLAQFRAVRRHQAVHVVVQCQVGHVFADLVHGQLLEIADQVGGARQVALDQGGCAFQGFGDVDQFGAADLGAAQQLHQLVGIAAHA